MALAKAIGVLNLLSPRGGLKATEPIIRLLFRTEEAFRRAITPLVEASVVQYRRFSGEYRVWQGTDFDIDARTNEEREKLGDFDLAGALRERVGATPILARRHSVAKGALRYFEVVFVDARSTQPPPSPAGPRIVLFLAENPGDDAVFTRVSGADLRNVWALHRQGAGVRTAIADVLALEGVQRGSQELAADPVAAREVRERLAAAQLAERKALNALIGNPSESDWIWRQEPLEIPDRRRLQQALSDVMDEVYRHTPVVRNELINRDRLSSQAAAARNKLFRHMLDQEQTPALGIRKYPPERAIYRSVLEAGHLHIAREEGWAFDAPGPDDPLHLTPVWERLDELLAISESAPATLETLMQALSAAPFGVKNGLFPILFLHYYLLHRSEIAVYDEGTYAPTLTYEHLERMVRRPDLFSFQRFRIEGLRAELFDEYSRALFGEVRDSVNLLDLARPLTRFVLGLDEHAQKTRRLSETTLRVRQAFFLSKSPEKFLFEELPAACGFDGISDLSGFSGTLIHALRELRDASANLLQYMHRALCASFALPQDTSLPELRRLLLGRCHGLERYTVDVQGLRSFIRRVGDRASTDEDWFRRLLLFLGHKPPTKWTDQDRDTAEYRLAEFTNRLLDLEKLRLHYEATSKLDSVADVVLIKTASRAAGELDEVVAMTERTDAAIADARKRIAAVLAEITDPELALALVARLTDDFLRDYRESHLSRRADDADDVIRQAG